MKRKGNGWVIEQLEVFETGLVQKELGDWDLREVTEKKIMNEIIKDSGV